MMSCTMEKGFKLWHTGDHIGAQAQLLLLPLLRMMVVMMVALMVVVAMIVYGEKREVTGRQAGRQGKNGSADDDQ